MRFYRRVRLRPHISRRTQVLICPAPTSLPRGFLFGAPLLAGGCGRHTVAINMSHEVRRLTFVFSQLHTSASVGSPPAGAFAMGAPMVFRLVHAQYERNSRRAYVELREDDADGGELIVTAIFTYRRTSIITKRALEQDLATKARHLMKRAAVGLDGR